MEQPREPMFYPSEAVLPIHTGGSVGKTLQSIDGTLKRIEIILLDFQKSNQRSPLDTLRDAVAASILEKKASREK